MIFPPYHNFIHPIMTGESPLIALTNTVKIKSLEPMKNFIQIILFSILFIWSLKKIFKVDL